MLAPRPLAALALLLATGIAAPARAQPEDCIGPPARAPIEVTPAVGASGVTLAAPVLIRYPAGYFDDPLVGDPAALVELMNADTGELVIGSVSVVADTLVFGTAAPFAAATRYEGIARGLDADLPFRFRTGSTYDLAPPQLGDVTAFGASELAGATCELPEGGYRIDVTFQAATDDGPLGDIEYLLYLTRGPDVEEPTLRARARNQTAGEVVMAFTVDASEIVSPICVSVIATDGVGNVDGDALALCGDPIEGNFFAPLCSAVPGSDSSGTPWPLAVAGVLIVLRMRRRRARP